MVLQNLFGGAIVAELPSTFADASDSRQIPDTQEVFVDSDVSIVIEVLQRVSKPTDEEAVKFHFEALAHDNDAISSTVQNPLVVHNVRGDQTPPPIILHGSQRIRKFNAVVPDDVDILMALFRVHTQGKSADLVVSVNIPRSSEGRVIVGEERAATVTHQFNSLCSACALPLAASIVYMHVNLPLFAWLENVTISSAERTTNVTSDMGISITVSQTRS